MAEATLMYKVQFDTAADYQYDAGGTFYTTHLRPQTGPQARMNSIELSPEDRLLSVKKILEEVKRSRGLEVMQQNLWTSAEGSKRTEIRGLAQGPPDAED